MTPTEFVRNIRANVEAFHTEQITYEEFSRKQRSLWDGVAAAGNRKHNTVLKLLRSTEAEL